MRPPDQNPKHQQSTSSPSFCNQPCTPTLMALHLRLMSPTSPESSNQYSPPTTPSADSSSSMSCTDNSLETPYNSPRSDGHQAVASLEDSEKSPPPATQVSDLRPWVVQPPAMAYVVSLLHAIPFLFRIEVPTMITGGEFPEPPDPLGPEETSREFALANP